MQVNHFSHMLLTLHLLPTLRSTPHSRLVCQSSDLHRATPSSTAFASVSEINTDIGPTYLYNRSKLAQILFIRALQHRLESSASGSSGGGGGGAAQTVYVNAVHPGGVSTDQPQQAEEAYGVVGRIGVALARPMMADPVKQGCRPALYAATAEEVVQKGVTGCYIVPDKKVTEPSGQAMDGELGERLWGLSRRILEEKLGAGEVPGV